MTMNPLIIEIKKLRDNEIGEQVRNRLNEFREFEDKDSKDWFCELCFCILAANAKGKNAWKIQNQIGPDGFLDLTQNKIRDVIKENKHRFHNNKSAYIIEARKHKDIKNIVNGLMDEGDEKSARQWLVDNVKGFGYKEASHFLRNTGNFNVAILDRHIINLLLENKYIDEKPVLNKNRYLEIEKVFNELADNIGMKPGELDLYMWYMKGGEVLK